MMLAAVIKKSLKEQARQFWILLLTVSMAPFFILIYYLIDESTKPVYRIVVVNSDLPAGDTTGQYQLYAEQINQLLATGSDSVPFPVQISLAGSRDEAMNLLINKKADAAVILPEGFTASMFSVAGKKQDRPSEVEFIGDLTRVEYMVSAVLAEEILQEIIVYLTGIPRNFVVRETGMGVSASASTFDLYVPGILILSIIMLMFSATIAIVNEVEQQTILRIRVSRLSTFQLMAGISMVQVMVGMISVFLTLGTAAALGFRVHGSFFLFALVVLLTCLSIIAFSLILAAITKTVNEVLVVGNFPLFLFMFFTGAAFPVGGKALFHVGDYPFTLQGLMSPTHAVNAMKEITVYGASIGEILPELSFLAALTILYFLAGTLAFKRRYMRA